jgi:hypothetical protein
MGYGVTYQIVVEICIYQMHALKQDSRPKAGIQYIQQSCVLDIGNVAILRMPDNLPLLIFLVATRFLASGTHEHSFRCQRLQCT